MSRFRTSSQRIRSKSGGISQKMREGVYQSDEQKENMQGAIEIENLRKKLRRFKKPYQRQAPEKARR